MPTPRFDLNDVKPGDTLRNTTTGYEAVVVSCEGDTAGTVTGVWLDDDSFLNAFSLTKASGWEIVGFVRDTQPLTVPNQRHGTPARDQIQESFLEFHTAHPGVFDEIVRLTRQARDAGQTRTSMKRIFEVLRWSRHVAGGREDEFKLNNNFTAHYARLVGIQHPDLADMFELRSSPRKDTAA